MVPEINNKIIIQNARGDQPASHVVSFALFKPRYLSASIDQAEANPQQGDLRLLGPPTGQGAGNGARTRDRRFPADLRADSLTTVPPTPDQLHGVT
ncbi:hypothetical protein PoB_001629300 [Plakobranchus ocellatus]|uniref:Uncharacterized protein n=1 Tax=Plakobranchus ocellatus TaxID=259542 RepID=A0AAV3Z554_9GAST|nr:hypothetical protein PoB_001629300 [Plakobranchus ocellatus]